MNKDMHWLIIIALFLVCLPIILYSQEFNTVYVINPLVGKVIDRVERDKYTLFQDINNFQTATAYKQSDGSYYLRVGLMNDETGLEESILLLYNDAQIQTISNQIDLVENIEKPVQQKAGVIPKSLINKEYTGPLMPSRRFLVLNGGFLTGIGSNKTEWDKGYIIGAYTYYSLSSKVAIGCRWAFTHCDINSQYNLLPEADKFNRADLSGYSLDYASGTRSMIEVLPSIRIALRRTRNTILSMQYSVGVYIARSAVVAIKGHKWEGNTKSVVYITSRGRNRISAIDHYIYEESGHVIRQQGVPVYDSEVVDTGLRGSKPGYSVGLSYNIKNIIDIQPALTFASREFTDLFKFKNCYFSLSIGLIVPEEIITNPPKPVPQN